MSSYQKKLLALLFLVAFNSTQPYTTRLVTGSEIEPFIPYIAQERLREYKSYPYLYDGKESEAYSLIEQFSKMPDSALVLLLEDDGESIVGYATGVSFLAYDEHFINSIKAFDNKNINSADCYYVPDEGVISSEHRTKESSCLLFKRIEDHARSLGYKSICFVTESHAEHPLKPSDYRESDDLWKSLEYAPLQVALEFSWNTITENNNTELRTHTLEYWGKEL